MRTLHVLAAALFAAGCAQVIGADEYKVAGADGTCAPAVGSYSFHFDEGEGGGCGAVPDRVVAISTETTGAAKLPENCTGHDIISANRCTETASFTCTMPNATTQTTNGSIDYAPDGKSGRGVWQVEIRDPMGKLLCGSVYTVTVARL